MSKLAPYAHLDPLLRLRLADLPAEMFENFFLHFLNAGISLTIDRNGERVERRINEASLYAAGSGRADEGVDLIAKVAGGETWAFQCKRRTKWSVAQTKKAIQAATYPAQHYFLLVACDPHKDVQKLIAQHPQWSLWNLSRICQEFRERVPQQMQPKVLYFLSPEQLKKFAPYSSDALIPASEYFSAIQQAGHSFHHRYPLVGRTQELKQMTAFAKAAKPKVLVVSGKGGEGKSRLLYEFAQTLKEQAHPPEVLFLNPHSKGDITLAMWDKDTPRVVVIDDAHRPERVSDELLSCIREAKDTKLVLATRPQANEALDERLRDHGFLPDAQRLEVIPLGKKDMRLLAEEALGPDLRAHANDLVSRTGDSPFLTVLAGDLLRRGIMKWGQWNSDPDFRAATFRAFSHDNLAYLPEPDLKQGDRLLRVIALLAPVTPDAVFHQRVGDCLNITTVDVEALLRRMQTAGIVSAEAHNVRVIPDLFADFLVFDTAFDSKHRLSQLVSEVIQKFPDATAALLRNLAEASWIAGTQITGREEFLRPLLKAEFSRFEGSSFYRRGGMLEQWATFSVFLPEETLALAKKAFGLKTAPADTNSYIQIDQDEDGINSYRRVRSLLPTLLRPVALWHDRHRSAALDLLWEIGRDMPRGILGGSQNHPWNVIADVIKFEPRKPITVIETALEWIAGLVRRTTTQEMLESNQAVLSTLLNPCFERFVEFNQWQGRTISYWKQPVDVKKTVQLREKALSIIAWVIDHGTWMAALEAVRTLEHALHRVTCTEISLGKPEDSFRAEWRPERLKALALFPRVLARHEHPMIRFAVRQLLQRDLAYEEDKEFAGAAREVLNTIPDNLDRRLASVLNSQGYFEFFDEVGAPKGEEAHARVKKLWAERVQSVAAELLRESPEPSAAIDRLDALVKDSLAAGHTPNFVELLPAIVRLNPDWAIRWAEILLDPKCDARITVSWYQVLFGLADGHADTVWRLMELASHHPRSELRRGIIQFLRFHKRGEKPLTEREQSLLEQMASHAGPEEAIELLTLIQWLDEAGAPWGFKLLDKLPLAKIPQQLHGEILAALNPYKASKVIPPLKTVLHVLDPLVAIPEIDVGHHGDGFERAALLYPRAIYDFVLKRIEYYEKADRRLRYQPLPREMLSRFRLPALAQDSEYASICEHLWDQASHAASDKTRPIWIELFQGIVLDNTAFWLPRLNAAIASAQTLKELWSLSELIHFDGSLVIFRFTELTAVFLRRAEELEGTEGRKRIQSSLYHATGPSMRSCTNGELDEKNDYVEAEAIKAAAAHAEDPDLGPFFRWIVEIERSERESNKRRHEADMASMDE